MYLNKAVRRSSEDSTLCPSEWGCGGNGQLCGAASDQPEVSGTRVLTAWKGLWGGRVRTQARVAARVCGGLGQDAGNQTSPWHGRVTDNTGSLSRAALGSRSAGRSRLSLYPGGAHPAHTPALQRRQKPDMRRPSPRGKVAGLGRAYVGGCPSLSSEHGACPRASTAPWPAWRSQSGVSVSGGLSLNRSLTCWETGSLSGRS